MSFDPIDLIKYVPPSAERVLEIAEAPSELNKIAAMRNPAAQITSVSPRSVIDNPGAFDCVVVFSPGSEPGQLQHLFAAMPEQSQILISHDAWDEDVAHALAAAGGVEYDNGEAVRAWRSPRAPRRVLLHCSIPPQSADDADVRIHQPNAFLRTIPGLRPVAEIEGFTPSLPRKGEERILLMHRSIPVLDRDRSFLQLVLELGYLIVLDLDDDPTNFPRLFQDGAFGLRCLHAIQVSTQEVAERVRGLVAEVAVFANEIPLLPTLPVSRPPPVRIFFGAYNREEDRDEILGPLNQLLHHFGPAVEVEVVHDLPFFDRLETTAKRFTPRCTHQEYLRRLADADIALLPLRDTPFNRCKSDLKFIECAAYGVAVLAPPVVYGQSIGDGRSGVLYRTIEEFAVGLQRLIQEPELRRLVAAGAHGQIRHSRMLSNHYEDRYAWYISLLDRADALRAAHRERTPQLF